MNPLLTDELWNTIALYLPERAPSPKDGRPRVPDRDCLRGILFVLREGVPWLALPKAMGGRSGSTCWRRFQEWAAAGLWHQAHCHRAASLGQRDLLNLERTVAGSASCRAPASGAHTGPHPTDRAKGGCKRHSLTDGSGIPPAVTVRPANDRDEAAVPELLGVRWMVPGRVSGRRRPGAVPAGRGYGFPGAIALVLAGGIRSLVAVRGSARGSGLGRTRFVVERTHRWFGHFRRLVPCYERQGAHFRGVQQLAACVIRARRVRHGRQPAEEFQPFAQAA